ncbi:MAG TPA: hypothetical protein PLH61_11195, partial [Bacteroidia bacterium]|nr:hypothetical protein [Bacteroidia bacterium]
FYTRESVNFFQALSLDVRNNFTSNFKKEIYFLVFLENKPPFPQQTNHKKLFIIFNYRKQKYFFL